VQNVRRVEDETGETFEPYAPRHKAVNILDRWIASSTSSLVTYIKGEMEAYRLYTVVPRLVSFIGQLTNIYVRYNRLRLKGKNGHADTCCALASLFDVLLVLCKMMAPFTPFFAEKMYQNLRRCLPGNNESSVHFCMFPVACTEASDKRIEASVTRMQAVIETGRAIRERSNKLLKLPLARMIVVHTDSNFLDDLNGELREYVMEELNVRKLEVCNDPMQYATVRAEPNFAKLGKRLGKSMGVISKAIKSMSQSEILSIQTEGMVHIEGYDMSLDDLIIKHEFQLSDGTSDGDFEAAHGDEGVMVVMDLTVDDTLMEAGIAREVVNRVQKLRKSSGLKESDSVVVYYELVVSGNVDADQGLVRAFRNQKTYLHESLGHCPHIASGRPAHAPVLAQETAQLSSGASFILVLAKPVASINHDALKMTCGGILELEKSVEALIISRERAHLVRDASRANGKIEVEVDKKKIILNVGKELHFD